MANEARMIEVDVDGQEAHGYLVAPVEGGKHPGLIVIQEWWGLNDHIKDIAGRFAEEGYVVLAPDLFDGKVTKDPEQAAQYMQNLDQSRALQVLNACVDFLKNEPNVNADNIGVTGFCMGGAFALLLAVDNQNIKASAPFYGDIPPDDVLKNLSAPVLFIGAENDSWITPEKMSRLKNAMDKYGKEGEVKVYSGAGHAFFNDTRPDAYNKEAAEDAWERVTRFLSEKLT